MPDAPTGPRLVLASASRTRQRLLAEAGLAFVAIPADLDEASLRESLRAGHCSAEDAVVALAEAKALAIARGDGRNGKPSTDASAGEAATGGEAADRASVIIGSDQILECDGVWYEKPNDLTTARRTLVSLRGRDHRLVSGVAVAEAGRIAWTHVDVAVMTMRPFTDAFLDVYLQTAGADALDTVAGYRYEGPGVQLFDGVAGDSFTILGLPLLPLLAYLRRCGAVAG